jgi:hypothetical protein
MKFMVARTSTWDSKPCEEAFEEEYVYIDERTVEDDPHKIPLNKGCEDVSWWYGKGKNHRVEGGRIKRDFVKTGWFIELDDLPTLLAFSDKQKHKVMVGKSWGNPEIYEIEIYDDYQE